ncbi:metallophosphoesterase [Plebeiibacterium sediminum]|uniref:Metallophosphoesterase n=1 Tax=Plebeiibacterium sediminum TaxID=2992112 RepID=A0AAE3M191_9BACT|nr:metallophosphoesterase [Plebeiobacterium sediminum]MCW3784885.1 metallophosphoesterase [Plebeiobacterium sediminum]
MLQKFRIVWFACLLIVISVSCKPKSETNNIQIAFFADVHLSDIYGEFEGSNYKGVLNPANQKYVNIRTMNAQLHSTRIFNENYFAFRAALDDVVKRNIKIVALPGDFSDDGQPYNIRGLKAMLHAYTKAYGIQFFAITGNHDPVAPFTTDAGKVDFLGTGGKNQPVMSKSGLYTPKSSEENPVVVIPDIRKLGYEEIVEQLSANGFLPQEQYKYWETPFSTYKYENYNYTEALKQSSFIQRSYLIDTLSKRLPDVSYLVEPVDGLWLMAIDGNVYLPAKENDNFSKAKLNSGGEYSNILAHKKHLLKWVEKVVKESKRLNKTLVTFSHYPMIDFYDGASDDLKALFSERKMQLHRVPDEDVAATFAEAGIKIHFAGHMHLNDTGIRNYEDGSFLVNIQIPSLAGYPAAYKVLTIHNPDLMEVETVKLDLVPGFNELFPLYEQEYSYLKESGAKDIWNKQVLEAKSYDELMNWHLKELVRLRFLKRDWPEDFANFMLHSDGVSLLSYAGESDASNAKNYKWSGFDMIFDFYRLLNGDQLAVDDIGVERIEAYQTIINAELSKNVLVLDDSKPLEKQFHHFIKAFEALLNGEPSDNFKIDLNNGKFIGFIE